MRVWKSAGLGEAFGQTVNRGGVAATYPLPGISSAVRKCAIAVCAILMSGMVSTGCGSRTVEIGAGPQEVESALFAAITAGDLATVKQEISRDGALLHQAGGGFEQTPLHRAVGAKQLAVAQFLLESGADPNALDVFNQTPLAIAMDVEAGNEMIRLLQDYGADD